MNIFDAVDFVNLVVSRRDVESEDPSATLRSLQRLTGSPLVARRFVERVDIAFEGYDHVAQELFEIQAVRKFVQQLDAHFPFWLFFLSKYHLGLQCILWCHLPPFLTDQAQAIIFPEQIGQLLTNHWFPAMNYMCEFTGLSDAQIDELTERALSYITQGRFPLATTPFRL